VDVANEVNVFHNIQTGERIYDYKMKMPKLRKINEVCLSLAYPRTTSHEFLQIYTRINCAHTYV
jgi:hypothetical protein